MVTMTWPIHRWLSISKLPLETFVIMLVSTDPFRWLNFYLSAADDRPNGKSVSNSPTHYAFNRSNREQDKINQYFTWKKKFIVNKAHHYIHYSNSLKIWIKVSAPDNDILWNYMPCSSSTESYINFNTGRENFSNLILLKITVTLKV